MECWQIDEKLYIPGTPNLGLKKMLANHFTIYSIDEFRTSKLSSSNNQECDHLIVKNKDGYERELHSVLTYINKNNNRMQCINRDENAVRNMKRLVEHYLEHGKRIPEFCRESKEEKELKKIEKDKEKELKKKEREDKKIACKK